MIHLNYRDGRPIYVQIVDGLRGQIQARILLPGEQLPSVRELAAELAINPNTIQRAYRELEMGGWIASVHGKGSFVCGVPSEAVFSDELAAFDRAVAAALAAGITQENLIRRIDLGGNDHA